ncbi:MAG: PCMD domain-containing protein [Bacteroidales bacterium]|nr:PCMD domain-containing protein [Bacteroidales bacterium]
MRQFTKALFIVFSFITIITSCITDEAPNAECDIIKVILENDNLKGSPTIENDRITFLIKPFSDVTNLAPKFELTPGATIKPESGTVRDFTHPQQYVVTSEDGNWNKVYTISFNMEEIKTKYSFENFELKDPDKEKYYLFYENGETEKQYIWASGNGGFQMVNSLAQTDDFPTTIEKNGVSGYAAKLTTKKTGSLGNLVKMPLAAGNLFLGSFNAINAIKNPLTATIFGTPFNQIPLRVKGWYKYTPGDVFTDKNNNVVDRTDECDIYAVLYEPTEDEPYLNGGNILSSENIIAMARIDDHSAKSSFTEFNINFVYNPNKEFSMEKLKDYKYNITIVFSSSIDGAYFMGAAGSTLIVDEVELICYKED